MVILGFPGNLSQLASAGELAIAGGHSSMVMNDGGVSFQSFTPGGVYINMDGLLLTKSGFGLSVREGEDCKQGIATLVDGTVSISNASVTANSRILLTIQDPNGGTPGSVYVSARVAGTSFDITSTSSADTSIVAYFITEAV